METPTTPATNSLLARQRLGELFFLALLVVMLVTALRIVQPYLHAFAIAALLAYIFRPLYRAVLGWVRGRANVAAGLACLLVAVVVLAPITAFTVVLGYRTVSLVQTIHEWTKPDAQGAAATPGTDPRPAAAEVKPVSDESLRDAIHARNLERVLASHEITALWQRLQDLVPGVKIGRGEVSQWVEDQAQRTLGVLMGNAVPLLGGLVHLTICLLLIVFALFFFFRDGARLLALTLSLCPLTVKQQELLVDRVETVTRSVLLGSLGSAAGLTLLAMIGLALVGLPWFFWGVVLGAVSLIPIVGMPLVWIPAAGYLALMGEPGKAVFLVVWCVGVMGTADYVIRLFLMRDGTGMSSLVLLIAILGGLRFFGLLGIFYGPLVFGLCAVLLYIYRLETDLPEPAFETAAVLDSRPPPATEDEDA